MTASRLPVLGDLEPDERRRLVRGRRRYGRREVLFHEGDLGDTLHVITGGHVAVRVTTPLGDVATLTVLGPGATFGELALLDPEARRTATVVALEPTETLEIGRAELAEARRRHPQIDRFLVTTLAAHVRRLSTMVLEALYMPVDRRVARRLLDLARVYDNGQAPAEIPLTQEDLANLAGTSRATANRALRDLAERAVLGLARGRITILDRDALARAAR